MSYHTLTIPHAFFLLLAVGVTWLFWEIIAPYALVLVTAGVVAIIVSPLERRLQKILKRKRLTAVFMVVGVFLLVVVPVLIVGILMIEQTTDLLTRSFAQDGVLRSTDLTKLPIISSLPEAARVQLAQIDVANVLKAIASAAAQNLASLFASTARLLFNVFLFFVAFYYILVDRDRLYGAILEVSPLKDTVDRTIINKMILTVRAVVFGSLVVALVQAVLAAIGLTLFGVPGSFIWGALVIIAAQIPMLGVGLVLAPAVLYLFILGHVGNAVGLLLWSVLIVGLVDNLLKPYLIEGKTRMHALLILISILGGLQFFGPIGLILGPTVLAAFLILLELYKSGILEKD